MIPIPAWARRAGRWLEANVVPNQQPPDAPSVLDHVADHLQRQAAAERKVASIRLYTPEETGGGVLATVTYTDGTVRVADRMGPDEALGVVAAVLFQHCNGPRYLQTPAYAQERRERHRDEEDAIPDHVLQPDPPYGRPVHEAHTLEYPEALGTRGW